MGVGKSTVARRLADKLPHSVYFDGDWAWDMRPFVVNTENIEMVHENIAFLLRQFLKNSQLENVVFTWVMQEQAAIDRILTDLQDCDFELYNFSLLADESTLRQHFRDDPTRDENGESLTKALSYLSKYDKINSVKIDRTGQTVDDTVAEILSAVRFDLAL